MRWSHDCLTFIMGFPLPGVRGSLYQRQGPGGWFNKKIPSYQYRKSHCGDKTLLRPSYLHNGISYTGKMTSLYWIRALVVWIHLGLYYTAPMIHRVESHKSLMITWYRHTEWDNRVAVLRWSKHSWSHYPTMKLYEKKKIDLHDCLWTYCIAAMSS